MKDLTIYSWKERFHMETFDVVIDGKKVAENVPADMVRERFEEYMEATS